MPPGKIQLNDRVEAFERFDCVFVVGLGKNAFFVVANHCADAVTVTRGRKMFWFLQTVVPLNSPFLLAPIVMP